MVLVVSPVEVDLTGVDEHEWKQDDKDLDGVFASVHKVSVKQIGLLQGGHAILSHKQQQRVSASSRWEINTAGQKLKIRRERILWFISQSINSNKFIFTDLGRQVSDLVENQQQVLQLSVQVACSEVNKHGSYFCLLLL